MNLEKKVTQRKITNSATILEALKQMNEQNVKLLIVLENDKFYSLLSIGDIQRSIINLMPLDTNIQKILRPNVSVSSTQDSIRKIKSTMLKGRAECMPIIDEEKNLVDIVLWEELFDSKEQPASEKINIPTVIMAGGQGTRLKPFTNIIPKPMIPIGDKAIVELIIDNFTHVGCDEFYLTVNYKSEILEFYLKSLDKTAKIEFIKEDKPLGTAGSLKLLQDRITSTFFVSNCDILIEQDYSEIYNYHKKNKNDITAVSAIKHFEIPYGILKTKSNGILNSLEEKPDYTFQINSGMYILEPHVLELIPENTFFHITNLIEKTMENDGQVGVFPVNEKSWFDIGQWNEYQQTLSHFES